MNLNELKEKFTGLHEKGLKTEVVNENVVKERDALLAKVRTLRSYDGRCEWSGFDE